jgi:hypothetical protein
MFKYYILFIITFFVSCNPVKQVLKDRNKFDQVAKEVIKSGMCANDTTFIVKSDTLVEFDTLVNIDIQVDTQKVNEFVYITNWKTRDIIKSVTIHDTVKSFIVDNARVRLLQADSARLGGEVIEWKGKAKRRQIWLFAIIAMILGALYIKSKI